MGIRVTQTELDAMLSAGATIGPAAKLVEPLPIDMSEKAFQSLVVRTAKANGFLIYHPFDSRKSESGFPDLVLIHPGRAKALFLELKTNTGAVSHAQQVFGQAMVQCGLDWRVFRPCQWKEIVSILEAKC